MREKCDNYTTEFDVETHVNCLTDMCNYCHNILDALSTSAEELLESYMEENGGDMPTSDSHPAFVLKKALKAFNKYRGN